jgi:hypothetical protein
MSESDMLGMVMITQDMFVLDQYMTPLTESSSAMWLGVVNSLIIVGK